jgi:hypothetical protein
VIWLHLSGDFFLGTSKNIFLALILKRKNMDGSQKDDASYLHSCANPGRKDDGFCRIVFFRAFRGHIYAAEVPQITADY